jgi:hypothetical protein
MIQSLRKKLVVGVENRQKWLDSFVRDVSKVAFKIETELSEIPFKPKKVLVGSSQLP